MTSPVTSAPPTFRAVSPQFTVPDVVAAAHYYHEILGFENRGFFGEPAVFVTVGRDAVEIFFNQDPDVAGVPRPRASIGYDAYLHVAGIDALFAELRDRGATIVEGPIDRSYAMREVVVQDCHGLRLAFGEDISQRAT